MTPEKPEQFVAAWLVYLTVALVMFFGMVFVATFIIASQQTDTTNNAELTATTYMDTVTALLANADPQRGATLVTRDYECYACHVQGADNIAPNYTGLKERAVTERPPLTAAAYIYESIVHPSFHLVAGYPDAMPKNYESRLGERDLGDILAYLLTQ